MKSIHAEDGVHVEIIGWWITEISKICSAGQQNNLSAVMKQMEIAELKSQYLNTVNKYTINIPS